MLVAIHFHWQWVCYSYDANGNIQKLARYDVKGTKFDALEYNYETKTDGYKHTTNKLRWVDDITNFTAVKGDDVDDQSVDNYTYDAIGNLIGDIQEEIDTIQWTVSGKVKKVIRTKNSQKPDLEFEYDASGQRIVKKVIKKDGKINVTYYLRDASGNVMSVYEYNQTDNAPILAEQYLYGSSRIGVYNPLPSGLPLNMGNRSFGRKSYELSDHLGNVRATLSDYRRLASQAIVNSAMDYYPFGMIARVYASSVMPRFGYGGQEKDNDILEGLYTAEYWQYDSRLGRRWNVDPITYAWQSSYACFNNNPIYFSDPSGLEGEPPKHKAVSGDTYGKLAKKYNVTVEQLRDWNGFADKEIPIGANLTVSDPKAVATAQTTSTPLSGVAKPVTSIEEIKALTNAEALKNKSYIPNYDFATANSAAGLTVVLLPRTVGGFTGLGSGAVTGLGSGVIAGLLFTSTTSRPWAGNTPIAIPYNSSYGRQPGEFIVYQIFSVDLITNKVQTEKYGISGQSDFKTKEGNPRPEYQVNRYAKDNFTKVYGYTILYITSSEDVARKVEQALVDAYYIRDKLMGGSGYMPMQIAPKPTFDKKGYTGGFGNYKF